MEKNTNEEKKDAVPKKASGDAKCTGKMCCNTCKRFVAIIAAVVVLAGGLIVLMNKKQTHDVRNVFADPLQSVEEVDVMSGEQFGYALGVTFGEQTRQLLAQVLEEENAPDMDALIRGMRDAMTDQELKLSDEQIAEILQERSRMEQEKAREDAAARAELGTKFLEEYTALPDTQQTDSGVLYTVEQAGAGPTLAASGSTQAMVNYTGTLVDGTEFDSSSRFGGDPVPFDTSQVIPGFGEAMNLMRAGDKWEIVIPSDLAYGPQGAPQGGIGPNEVLIFEVEVVEIIN